MNTNELAESFSAFYPSDFLTSRIEFTKKFLPEKIEYALPSIQLGKDGLMLSSLILVTDNYLCELRLGEAKTVYEFDIVAKSTVYNYRVRTWTHEIKEEEVVKASFELSEVNLLHDAATSFKTQLFFAGDAEDREAWLNKLTQAIPIKLVLGFSRSID